MDSHQINWPPQSHRRHSENVSLMNRHHWMSLQCLYRLPSSSSSCCCCCRRCWWRWNRAVSDYSNCCRHYRTVSVPGPCCCSMTSRCTNRRLHTQLIQTQFNSMSFAASLQVKTGPTDGVGDGDFIKTQLAQHRRHQRVLLQMRHSLRRPTARRHTIRFLFFFSFGKVQAAVNTQWRRRTLFGAAATVTLMADGGCFPALSLLLT